LGISPDDLSREYDTIQRHPIIAEGFSWSGPIEKWAGGTSRVIAQYQETSIAPLEFREVAGSIVIPFRVQVVLTLQVTPHVTPKVDALVWAARRSYAREELQQVLFLYLSIEPTCRRKPQEKYPGKTPLGSISCWAAYLCKGRR
jgi:predicted HTH transcriptional regulator